MLKYTDEYHLRIVRVNVEKLKGLRTERSLSLRELAAASGVSHNTIWLLERGQGGAHPRTVRKLAEAFGVAPRELMAEVENDA